MALFGTYQPEDTMFSFSRDIVTTDHRGRRNDRLYILCSRRCGNANHVVEHKRKIRPCRWKKG